MLEILIVVCMIAVEVLPFLRIKLPEMHGFMIVWTCLWLTVAVTSIMAAPNWLPAFAGAITVAHLWVIERRNSSTYLA